MSNQKSCKEENNTACAYCGLLQCEKHTSQQGRYQINREGRLACLAPTMDSTVLLPERENKRSPASSLLPTQLPENQFMQQGTVPTVQSSPTGFLPDFGSKSINKLQPKVIGRVMSEIHSNLPQKDLASKDLLNVLVDRVIAEVANEINLYDDDDSPLIYPALAQTNMLPKSFTEEKTESMLSSHIYEEPSDPEVNKEQPNEVYENLGTEGQSQPSEITVEISESTSDTLSTRSSEHMEPMERSTHCTQRSSKDMERIMGLLTSSAFLWSIFLLFLTLFLLFVSIIFGAFLGLAICGPHSCSRNWQSPNPFLWSVLSKSQTTDVYGLF